MFRLTRSLFRLSPRFCRQILLWSFMFLSFSRSVDSGTREPLLREANRLSWLGNWNAAGPLYEQAELKFKAQGNKTAEVYARIGRIRAQGLSRSVEEVSRSLRAELENPLVQSDPRLRLWCLAARAAAELEVDVASSKQHWTEALEIASRRGEDKWITRAQGELGIIAFVEGDTGTAVRLVGGALISALASGDYAEQVRLLSMLGIGYNEVHRYEESLWFFQHALSIAEHTRDMGFPYMAYEGRATALSAMGKTAQAREILERVLNVALSQNRRDEESQTLVLLGENSIRQGDSEQAKSYFIQGSQIASNGKFYRNMAQALSDEAAIFRQEGNLRAAQSALTDALRVSRRLGDTYNLPKNLTDLAEVNAAQLMTKQADRLFRSAEDVMDGILVRADSRVASRAMTNLIRETYIEHFKLVRSRGQIERAVELIERLHTRSSESRVSNRPNNDRASGALKSLESEVTRIQLKLLQTDKQGERSALLDELLQIERHLAYERNELVHTEIVTTTASLKQIQSALHPDEGLVEYVVDDPHSFAILLTRKLARIVTLPAGKSRIGELVSSYADHLKDDANEAASELYRILVEPIQPLGKPRLIFCSDRALSRLPLESLRDITGRYLVESKIISYSPSGSTVWAQRRRSNLRHVERSLLAVGDVDYSHTVAQSKLRGLRLPAMITRGLEKLVASQIMNLPESREEVLSINRALGWKSTLLLGNGATETVFKLEPLSEFNVIHLAVHAVPDAQYPERASLVLGTDSAKVNDGLLQVREIMYLRLDADLVTLSACETGTSGEPGVISMGEAFLIAGARAVVVSLWSVEDHSTTLLMEYFYTHLAKGEDKATALAEAKRDFLSKNKGKPPFYWAGFVMVGEGAYSIDVGNRL
jgi:CHAT domain-containing protein